MKKLFVISLLLMPLALPSANMPMQSFSGLDTQITSSNNPDDNDARVALEMLKGR